MRNFAFLGAIRNESRRQRETFAHVMTILFAMDKGPAQRPRGVAALFKDSLSCG
jgi:hypothetical protein